MRPLFHPILINGRFGDSGLFVGPMFEKRAVQFDLGDLAALPARRVLRIAHVFVSHAHIHHFVGFDALLRVLVCREATVHLYGPSGFIERVGHKLQPYQWNLADRFLCDLMFMVSEVDAAGSGATAQFRAQPPSRRAQTHLWQ